MTSRNVTKNLHSLSTTFHTNKIHWKGTFTRYLVFYGFLWSTETKVKDIYVNFKGRLYFRVEFIDILLTTTNIIHAENNVNVYSPREILSRFV